MLNEKCGENGAAGAKGYAGVAGKQCGRSLIIAGDGEQTGLRLTHFEARRVVDRAETPTSAR